MTSPAQTITARLHRRLLEEPDTIACYRVAADGSSDAVTVKGLLQRAMAFAAAYGPPAGGEIIAICLYPSLDLHAAFLGALWAGHIPTMLPPPSPRMEPRKYTESFQRVLEHVRPSALVVSADMASKLDLGPADGSPRVPMIVAETIPASAEVAPHRAAPEDIAVLQHSSGTTGLQKGIALSHAAVLRHNAVYGQRLRIGPADTIASWLPLYHDMGFVAAFLLPLCERIPFVEMSPFDWVLRPALLLEQIHAHRATLCWLPNFAFAFMAKTIADDRLPAGLDLSSIRAWVSSSEPVTHAATAAFVERFGAHGVSWSQITASYAMAENVYAVTQSLPGGYRVLRANRRIFLHDHRVELDDAEDALSFVSNGTPLESTALTILDDDGRPLADGFVGQIALRGAHLFSGYFDRDDLTAAAMTSDGWYRTGDLGFMQGGELFITGRKKDLVIVQGRNFYPGDVEDVVGRLPDVRSGRVVAFGVDDPRAGTEGLVILAEIDEQARDRAPRIALEIRRTVAQQFDCTPADVRVLPQRWLVKSTSGKLARSDNRAKYLAELRGATARVT